jgi:hypothetical protein
MPLYRTFLQTLGATLLLALALACGGKNKNNNTTATNTVVLSGTVTYTRVPLAKDANGIPTGLVDATVATNLQILPARGTRVRVYQQIQQTQPDGTKTLVWVMDQETFTDSLGNYAMEVTMGRPTMVELLSSFDGGNNFRVNVVAEPSGIQSPTSALDRLRYAMRKGADGSAPAGVNTPASLLSAASTVNFSVGLKDPWWLVDPSFNLGSREAPLVGQATLETDQPGRSSGEGTGSRVLGIGDTLASHLAVYTIGTPSADLDLHYWPGRSEPRGTYIEYDPLTFPQAYDSSENQYHLFGTIQGGATNDDAWDEGVLLPLFARNALYSGNLRRTFSVALNPLHPVAQPLKNLSPDMARIEGLADAMAAAILKSPYLADTQGVALAVPVKDIRDISSLAPANLTPYCAPAMRALAWEIILKANSLTSPGLATDWANINPLATKRFFTAPTMPTNGATDSTARDVEPLNIFSQVKRLQETKTTAEPVDLATIFTDGALTPMLAPFGLTWPRPTTGPEAVFMLDWGTDPNSTVASLAPIAFSMAGAVQVNGVYPNLSQGEVAYAGFLLNTDKRYVLSTVISPALGAGAQLDLDFLLLARTFSFTGVGGSSDPVVIPMSGTAPYFHPVRLHLRSPSTLQPDVTVTVAFTPVP